jgi:ABC-type protease/lipase transport system fused ATPase/permease subunit
VLSGGQRQRIGLARALYGDPKLLVLDEPNASLDSEGELALQQAVAQLKKDGATVILITHKVSILSGVDKLLIMQDGAVAVFGPRDEVLQKLQQQQQQQLPPRQLATQPAAVNNDRNAVNGEEVPRG